MYHLSRFIRVYRPCGSYYYGDYMRINDRNEGLHSIADYYINDQCYHLAVGTTPKYIVHKFVDGGLIVLQRTHGNSFLFGTRFKNYLIRYKLQQKHHGWHPESICTIPNRYAYGYIAEVVCRGTRHQI